MFISDEPIIIMGYDDGWPVEYRRRARELELVLGPLAQRIDHIGSTAVRGLAAKPTIDIQISVDDLERIGSSRGPIEALGYRFDERSLADLEHRFFLARGRAAHIHVCPSGSGWERAHLLFRDYLRGHLDVTERYAALKGRLAKEHRWAREAYVEAKIEYIEAELARAEHWAIATGWSVRPEPALEDA